MDRPRRSVEQIEVIEHRVIEEGRRPIGSGGIHRYDRTADDILDRYRATGETDVSREPSFIHNSANYGQQLEISPIRAVLNTSAGSGPHRVEFADTSGNTILNQYGYDVHEIHTADGGARIVETHGGGPLHETSRLESTRIDEVVERPGISSALRGGAVGGMSRSSDERSRREVFTVSGSAPPRNDSWKNVASDSESFVRQDSYKRMQRSDELMASPESAKVYAPRSQTSLVSRSTRDQQSSKSSLWSRIRSYVMELYDHFRNADWTPRLIANVCCILLLLLLLFILFGIILNALFGSFGTHEFLLYPPVCEECRRKNPNLVSAAMPSSVYIHQYSSDQAHFELRGNPPFKSNSFTAIDFTTGYIAIADHALTTADGRHFACFLMPLDKNAIPSMDALMEAVGDSDSEIQSTFGWQEFWQFEAQEINPGTARSKFSSTISDCEGNNVKWYLLKQSVHARDLSCSTCYDFCLPDWAVVRKEKYEDESTIGIRRLDCFRLWVPQWDQFRTTEDQTGGHFVYPLSSESTKRDKNGEWSHWIPTAPHRNRRSRLAP